MFSFVRTIHESMKCNYFSGPPRKQDDASKEANYVNNKCDQSSLENWFCSVVIGNVQTVHVGLKETGTGDKFCSQDFFLKYMILDLIYSLPWQKDSTAGSYVEKHFIYNPTNAKRYQTSKPKTLILFFHYKIVPKWFLWASCRPTV